MRKYWIFCSFCLIICATLLSSCGCGPTFLYNWRPKPWIHPFVADSYTGLDTLINIDGYYATSPTIDGDYYQNYSIMFYKNGLCTSLTTRVVFTDAEEIIPLLDTLYSSNVFAKKYRNESYKKYNTSWGTYEIKNDTIKAFLIENLSGCDGTRKNVISMTYLISDNREIKQIFISSSSKEYGYEKILDIPHSQFYPIENKRDSNECPYLKKSWFYKAD